MSLRTAVEDRYSEQKLVEATNWDSVSAEVVNTTILDLACSDVESDFRIHVNSEFDDTNTDHLNIGTDAVLRKLRVYSGRTGTAAEDEYREIVEKMKQLAGIGARDRILPATDGAIVPSSNVTPQRPRFDFQKFNGIRPR